MGLIVTACGGTPESTPAIEEVTEKVMEETVNEVAEAAPIIFTWVEAVDPFGSDPRTAYDGQGHPVLGQAYKTLPHFNPLGSDPEISPELALSWESNEDATKWTFVLREGIVFHDGTPLNVEILPSYNNQFIMLNNVRPPLDNVMVRQALLANYPYQDVLDNLVGGHATLAGGTIPQ